eukprot:9318916-Karenia_brevis.AAC.1
MKSCMDGTTLASSFIHSSENFIPCTKWLMELKNLVSTLGMNKSYPLINQRSRTCFAPTKINLCRHWDK